MISVFMLIFMNDNIIEDKFSTFLFQKCVYQSVSPSHEFVPSSSQFQKGWLPLLYNMVKSLINKHTTKYVSFTAYLKSGGLEERTII